MSNAPVRVLFVSDIHSNLEALQAVLVDAGDLPLLCLGDAVGYGASPNQVVELLRARGATCVMGNHDNAVATGQVGRFNSRAAVAAAWTSRKLSEENMRFLAALPRESTLELGEARVYVTHGSPDDNLWEYVYEDSHRGVFGRYLDMERADAIGLGHTHVPFVWSERGRMVFNPGSVGQPRDGDPRASYAVVSADGASLSVEHRRVGYDIESAARKIREEELPAYLAERLFEGR